MNTAPRRRWNPAVTVASAAVAVLALVASGTGLGYAAATVGAKDLKKNSVTSAKIKKNAVTTKKIKNNAVNGAKIADGSVSVADLAAQEKQQLPALQNGGGDCVWTGGASLPPPSNALNVGSPSYRKDLLGTVHLAGLVIADDSGGGDGVCGDDFDDQIPFVLPAAYAPAKTILNLSGTQQYIIVGAAGLVSGSISLPAGTVVTDPAAGALVLDGITYLPAGSALAAKQAAPRGQGQLPPAALSLLRGH